MKSIIKVENKTIHKDEIQEILDYYWAWRAMFNARPAYITYIFDRLFVLSDKKYILSGEVILSPVMEEIIKALEGAGINVIK